MKRRELVSSNAAMLIEATRAGVVAGVAGGPALHRAHDDFDVDFWR